MQKDAQFATAKELYRLISMIFNQLQTISRMKQLLQGQFLHNLVELAEVRDM